MEWDNLDQLGRAELTGYEAGKRDERERIIALLNTDCKDGIGDSLQGCFHEVAIALIKGEQK